MEVGKRKLGGIQTHSKHVDIYERSEMQCHMQNNSLLKFRSIMEAVNWVHDDVLEEHVWVSELTMLFQETKVLEPLQYDLANLCSDQWRRQ